MNEEYISGEEVSLKELAGLRQGVYRLLSALFLYPDLEWMDTFPPLAHLLREESRPLAQFAF